MFAILISKQKDKNMQKKFTVLELFAGAGGLALGLEQAGLKTEALVEIDSDCCKTLRINRPKCKVIESDVSLVDFKQFRGVDVVTGGFPCQAFSYAGKKLGFKDQRGSMVFQFIRAIEEIRPKIFLGENVKGLLKHDNGRTLRKIIRTLKSLGYNVEHRVINAVKFGVPQKRERLIIIGTLPGFSFEYPEETTDVVTLGEALKDVPKSPGLAFSERKKKIMEMVPPGGCWVNLPEDIQKDYMGVSLYSGGGKRGMARRMSWSEPSLTLTTSPSQKQTERCHPEETRPFTVREYARIQTFPDDWEFFGSIYSQYKQIGNAVPVKVGKTLGKSIKKTLENPVPVNIPRTKLLTLDQFKVVEA